MLEPQKIANEFLQNLVANCESGQPLCLQLIEKLDVITQQFLGANDSKYAQVCQQAWLIIQKSDKFWENSHLLITNSVNQQTILQILIKIHERIKINWIYEDIQIRDFIKNLMCNFAKQFPSLCQPGSQKYRIQFRKINSIIVEILKYQWNNNWNNFLFEICQAMINQNNLAQNYFDLISVAFQEIFDSHNHLTSNQIRSFKKKINNNSGFLFQTLQTFLKADYPTQLLKNCLTAFQNMIPVLSPSSIYLNFSFLKIVRLIENPQLSLNVLNCILAFFKLNYDDSEKIIKSKLLQCKQKILMQMLSNENSSSHELLTRKMIDVAACVIDNLQNEIVNQNQQHIKVLVDNNVFICSKLSQIICKIPAQDTDIKIYTFLVKYAKHYSFKPFLHNLISLTSCPITNQFFRKQKVFTNQSEYQIAENEIPYQQFEKIYHNLIKISEKQYLQYLLDELEKQINNIQQLRFFCKLCWNFYIYLNYASDIAEKFLIFTNKVCQIQQKSQKIMNENLKFYVLKVRVLGCCRANLLLILGHPNSLKNAELRQVFIHFTTKSMMESDSLVQFSIQVLKRKAQKFTQHEVHQIKQCHIQSVNSRSNRNKLDQLFLGFICSWLLANNSNIRNLIMSSRNIQSIVQILTPYRNKLSEIRIKKAKAKADFNGMKLNLLNIGVKLLILYQVILKYNPQIIQKNHEYLKQLSFLLMLRQTCDDLKGIQKFSEFKKECCSIQKLLLLNLLPIMFEEEEYLLSQNLFNIITQNINIEINEESSISFSINVVNDRSGIDDLLDLVISFITSMKICNGNQKQKTKAVVNIAEKVSQFCFEDLNSRHLQFIDNLVQSAYFSALTQQCVSRIIYQIFDFCQGQKQQQIQQSHSVLSHLLTNAIDKIKDGGQTSIEKVIMHLTCNIFKIIIRQQFSNHYLSDYCSLLFLSIEVTKSLQYKFHQKQTKLNIQQMQFQLAQLIRNQYHYLNSDFLVQITTKRLSKILQQTQNFTQDISDFLIQLKRGFTEQQPQL